MALSHVASQIFNVEKCSDVIKTFYKTKTKTFLWCILEADRKAFVIFSRKRKCRRKWNSISVRKRKENENRHSFSAEKRKRQSPGNISVFFLFIHSVTKSALQCAANISSSFAFLQVVLVDGIPLSSYTVWHFSRWHFNPWTVCFPGLLLRVKAVFHNRCTVLYWRLCGLTNSPHC